MRRLLPFIFLFIPLLTAAAQSAEGSLEWYRDKAQSAISESNYESAVKILTEAKLKYPLSPKVNIELADLYYDKELWSLALDEYRAAEKKGSADFATLNQIARTLGKLNRDRESIDYLLRIHKIFPDSMETVDDLGWMYFKTFQLEKGEEILLAGIRKHGRQRDLLMTLGTVYAGMKNYDAARSYYLASIEDALKAGDDYFASIAYYNLSLLEHDYFHFNSALAYTEDSIAMQDRPSGRLARGELYQSRMDYRAAMGDFEAAFAQDSTPLTRVNMAILNRKFGRLDLARRNAEEALAATDLAWMLYYGTDAVRHYKDIREILAETYEGLATVEATRPTAGLLDWIGARFTSLRYRLIAWYHRLRFGQYSLEVGRTFEAEGRQEDAFWEYYMANTRYKEVAASYLARCRAMETARTPHAEYYYLYEEGKLRGSAELLEKAVSGMDPFWEREGISDSLVELARVLPAGAPARRDALNRLFDVNPGAFRQNGFGLPLRVIVEENSWGGTEMGKIFRYLQWTGCELSEAPGAEEGFRFTLRMGLLPGGTVRYSVTDGNGNRVIAEGSRELTGGRAARCAGAADFIIDDLYRIR